MVGAELRGAQMLRLYLGDVNPVVTSHEIGHLLGMGHSTFDLNNDGEIVPADGDREYGDPKYIMGGFGRYYSLAHKERQNRGLKRVEIWLWHLAAEYPALA